MVGDIFEFHELWSLASICVVKYLYYITAVLGANMSHSNFQVLQILFLISLALTKEEKVLIFYEN